MRFSVLYVADFAAWAARWLEPSLRKADLLVQSGGRVVARSEGLRATIGLGWDIERARAQALGAEVRPHSGARARLAWEALLDAVNERTPWLEGMADGTLLPGAAHRARERALRGGAARAEEAPALLRAHARAEGIGVVAARFFTEADAVALASALDLRVGIAEDRATALLAAASAQCGTGQRVPAGREVDFRAHLPLGVLQRAGISEATVQRLFWLGFKSVGSLARLTERQVVAQLDDGRALFELVHGIGHDPVPTFMPPPRVEAAYNAEQPMSEPAEYEPVLQHLLLRAMESLEEREAQLVSVHLARGARTWSARRIAHQPTADFRTLSTLARIAAREARREGEAGVAFDRMVLILGGLRRPKPFQEVLWKERDTVRKAIEDVETRFPGSGLRWVARDPDAYLPEEAYQLASALTPVAKPARPRPAAPAKKRAAQDKPRRRIARRSTGGTVRHDGSVAVDDSVVL